MTTTDSALRELVDDVAYKLRVAADNPSAHGGQPGLIVVMNEQAGRLESILAASASQQSAPAGMVPVPRELTPEMYSAFNSHNGEGVSFHIVQDMWGKMLSAAPTAQPPTLNEAFDQVGAAMRREVCGEGAPAAQVADGIDPTSRNFKKGMEVGLSCEHELANKIRNPVCDRCGARNAEEASEKCSPSDDSCPGTEFPLSNLWELSKGNAPAAYPSEDHGCVYENGDGICRECADLAAANKAAAQVAHADDIAVDMFAAAMKEKLAAARAKGRGGWDDPEDLEQYLSNLLRAHVEKGDPRDVANFCCFLWNRGEAICAAPAVVVDEAMVERLVRTLWPNKIRPDGISKGVLLRAKIALAAALKGDA